MHHFKTRLLSLLLVLAMVLTMLPMTVLASDTDADVEDIGNAAAAVSLTLQGSDEAKYYYNPELTEDSADNRVYTSAEKAFAAALKVWKSANVGAITFYTDITLTDFPLFSTSSSVIAIGNGESLTLNLGDYTLATSDTFLSGSALPYFFHLSGTSTGDLIINGGKIRYGSETLPATRSFLQIGNNSTQGWDGEITFNNVDIHCISSTFIFSNKSLNGDITLNGGKFICSDNYIVSSGDSTYNTANTTVYLTGGVQLITKQSYVICAGTAGSSVVIDDAVIYTNYTNYTNGDYEIGNETKPGLGIMAGVNATGGSDSKYGNVILAPGATMSADETKINLDTFTPHIKYPDTEYNVYKLTISPKKVTPAATAVKAVGVSIIPGQEMLFYTDTTEDVDNRTYTTVDAALKAAVEFWKTTGVGTINLYRSVAVEKGESNRLIHMGQDQKLTLNIADGVTVSGTNLYFAILEYNAEFTINGGNFIWGSNTFMALCFANNPNFTGTVTFNNINAVVTGGGDFLRCYAMEGDVIFNGGCIKTYRVTSAGAVSGSGFVANIYKTATGVVDSATTYHLRGGVELWAYQYTTMRVGTQSKVYVEDATAHALAKSTESESSIKDDQAGCWSFAGNAKISTTTNSDGTTTSTVGSNYTGNNVVLGNEAGTLTTQVSIGDRVQYPELEAYNTDDVRYLATNVTIKFETYNITWYNDDGTVLEADKDVVLNSMPTFNGGTPSKASTSEYNYFFAGWDKEVVKATENATYTATYTAVPVSYTPATLDLLQDANLYKSYGRMYAADHGLAINWPGSGIEFNVNCGGELTMTYYEEESDGWFRCFVDGQEAMRGAIPSSTNNTITIARGIAPGNHTIRLIREHDTSSSGKKFELTSIGFYGSKDSITRPADKDLLIEFVGDSITSGKGAIVELLKPGQVYGTGSHSGTASYAYVASQMLNVDWSMLSRGSAGYFRTSTSCPKTIEHLYPYYNGLMTNPTPYVPARQADIAVLALCTNDGDTTIKEAVKNNTTSYKDSEGAVRWLVNAVRNFHGDDVKIVIIHNMMTNTSASWLSAFNAVAENDPNTWVLKTTKNNEGGASEAGKTGHPSEAGHAKVAQELATFLEETVIPTISTEPTMLASMEGHTLQFVVNQSDVTSGCTATVTRTLADGTSATETIPMANWETVGSQYRITYAGLDAKGIGDAISVEIKDTEGKVIVSWNGTADDIAAKNVESADEATKNTALALLGYSAAANAFFGYDADAENTFATQIAALKEENAAALTTARKDNSKLSGTGAELVLGSSMVLDSEMTMRFYFSTNDISVMMGSAHATLALSEDGTAYYCEVAIAPEDVFDTISVQVTQNGTTVATATDSPASYFARLYTDGDDAAKALADAVLLYGLVANAN